MIGIKKVAFINANGDQIQFFYYPPLFINSIEGLGDVDAEIQTQKSPEQDGSTHIHTSLKERHLSIEVAITRDYQANKQLLSRVFNPKLGDGFLIYENDGVKREIKAIPEHVPTFPDSRRTRYKLAQIDLLCPGPFWLTEEQVEQLVVWEGGLEFPLQLPTEFARQSQNKAKILLNDGDVDTPIFVTFAGPATSPITVINKTTGKFIRVNQDLLVGEKLEINTAFGQKRVTKVLADGTKQNAFHFITLDSTFFNLIQGNNLIDYSTGADYERAAVSITWRHRYVGV